MTVKRWSRGPGANPIGKPAVHPATVDLKGKAYQYVFIANLFIYYVLCYYNFYSRPGNSFAIFFFILAAVLFF